MKIGSTIFNFRKTYICGILNVTPDSFSDGGLFFEPEKALKHARRLAGEGADIIDIGGESTRPGSDNVPIEEELRRVRPVIKAIKKETDVPVSIDTCKPEVAEECISFGADMVNDITGLTNEKMLGIISRYGIPAIAMHMKGKPKDMQANPFYENVVKEIFDFFQDRLNEAKDFGANKIIIDPGIGFGKTVEHNLSIIKHLHEFKGLGKPIMIGPSRKSFIGKLTNTEPDERLGGTIAACVISIMNGANIVRVHDVEECRKAIAIADAVRNAK